MKTLIKIKELEIEMVHFELGINPNLIEFKLKELKKFMLLINFYMGLTKKCYEIIKVEFEMDGKLPVGDQIGTTQIRFRNFADYEAYINSIDEIYDADGAFFKGFIYKINSPKLNLVDKSQYGNGCDFKHEVIV